MSRSNPEVSQNPSVRWFEWDGENGNVRYYDKEEEKNINVDLPFTFLVLDQLGTVKGWHNESESGIYANEVKRVDQQPLTVKAFNGGVIAEGLYTEIKDTVKAKGGRYVSSIYVAFKKGNELVIGNLALKGAALSAWMDFTRKAGKKLYDKAVTLHDFVEGSKGSIVYRVPQFNLKDISEETNQDAIELDKSLQEYLKNKLTAPAEDDNVMPSDDELNSLNADPYKGQEAPGAVAQQVGDNWEEDIEDDLPF